MGREHSVTFWLDVTGSFWFSFPSDKFYILGGDSPEKELIKNGWEKRSEIFKYFHFCAKIFLHESSSSNQL